MGNSLQDQLKKQGLVDKKKVQEVKRSQYKDKKQKSKKGSRTELDEAKLAAQKAHSEKVERDRQLNLERKREAEQKAIAAQIKQLIETNRIESRDGDIAFNFTDNNVIKRIHVSERIHSHLSKGLLSIAKLGDTYELVPSPVAEKIKQRDSHCIIDFQQADQSTEDENDPYADYKIPDDLMW